MTGSSSADCSRSLRAIWLSVQAEIATHCHHSWGRGAGNHYCRHTLGPIAFNPSDSAPTNPRAIYAVFFFAWIPQNAKRSRHSCYGRMLQCATAGSAACTARCHVRRGN